MKKNIIAAIILAGMTSTCVSHPLGCGENQTNTTNKNIKETIDSEIKASIESKDSIFLKKGCNTSFIYTQSTNTVSSGVDNKADSKSNNNTTKKNKSKKKKQNKKSVYEKVANEYNTRISERLYATDKVQWFKDYKEFIDKYSDIIDRPETIYDYYSEDQINLLLRVVQAEIGDYSFEQKCNVASVILNRVNSDRFPNTLYEVLTSPRQFTSVSNGRIWRYEVDEETRLACEYVFSFGDTTYGALFFDSDGSLNYPRIFNDGAHNFYGLAY